MGFNRLGSLPGDYGHGFERRHWAEGVNPIDPRPLRFPAVSRITARWGLGDPNRDAADAALLRLLTQLANCGLAANSPPLIPRTGAASRS